MVLRRIHGTAEGDTLLNLKVHDGLVILFIERQPFVLTARRRFIGGNFQHQGSRVSEFVSGTPVGYERPTMPAYNTLNLHAGLSRVGLTFEVYVKNVADAYGLTRIASEVQNGYGPPLAVAVIQPRTFGLSISEKF